jgi:hypothetical protein
MSALFWVVLVALVLVAAGFLAVRYARFRAQRVVTCPDSQKPEVVRLDGWLATLTSLGRKPRLHLTECSHWPEKEGCAQTCLSQVEPAPHDCLLVTTVSKWFEGRICAVCRKPFDKVDWWERKPALMDADRRTVPWSQVPSDRVFDLLKTHQPVCWNCHVAESFRQAHPELVVDRPAH